MRVVHADENDPVDKNASIYDSSISGNLFNICFSHELPISAHKIRIQITYFSESLMHSESSKVFPSIELPLPFGAGKSILSP